MPAIRQAGPDPYGAILFPSNGSTSNDVRIAFNRPDLAGMGLWGPSNAGVTVLQRVKSVAQTGYYTWIFYAVGDTASRGNADFPGNANSYWGMHPYPPGGAGGTTQLMEIAANSSDQTVCVDGVSTLDQQNGVWAVVGARIIYNGDNSKTIRYYPRLPLVDNANVIQFDLASTYGTSEPSDPMLMVGDNSWYNAFQHERGSAAFSAQIIYPYVLTEPQLVAQANNMTSCLYSNPWSFLGNFSSVEDLTCKAGTGHNWAWVSSARGTFVARN